MATSNPTASTSARLLTLGWNVVGVVVLGVAVAVLAGLVLNTALGAWWADPLAGFAAQ